MSDRPHIIVCRARDGGEPLEEDLLRGLARWPELPLTVLPHLYDLASDGPGVESLRSIAGDMVVLTAMHPRAAFWALDANGIRGRMGHAAFVSEQQVEPSAAQGQDSKKLLQNSPRPLAGEGSRAVVPGVRAEGGSRTIWCVDLRTHSEAGVYLEEIGRIVADTGGSPLASSATAEAAADGRDRHVAEATRARWYPVVDRDRCRGCLECLNFCLFGVYGLDEAGMPLVEEPDACRDGCPACARICPAGAILFPAHADPAIAGGVKPAAAAPTSTANLDRLVDDVDQMDL